jgi:hypothetical protein
VLLRGRCLVLLPRVVRSPLLGVAEQLVGRQQRQEVVLVGLRASSVWVQLLGALRQAGQRGEGWAGVDQGWSCGAARGRDRARGLAWRNAALMALVSADWGTPRVWYGDAARECSSTASMDAMLALPEVHLVASRPVDLSIPRLQG